MVLEIEQGGGRNQRRFRGRRIPIAVCVVVSVLSLIFGNLKRGLSYDAFAGDWSASMALNNTYSSSLSADPFAINDTRYSDDRLQSHTRSQISTGHGTTNSTSFQQIPPKAQSFQDHEIISYKPKVAYAVSVTGCTGYVLDAAAVLRHSIHSASRSSKYDYAMIAFVHPGAVECGVLLSKLHYEVKILDTPFNETEISNIDLIEAQGATCCGFKEFLKLYSYLETSYPVVVHLDMDCLVLKPFDEVFDLMLDPSFDRTKIDAMWLGPSDFPEQVDFLFTRDYNMVEPPYRQPHQIGVQGGFMIFRPNATDFQRNIDIITSGGNFHNFNWGDSLGYGGYYGAATIQGLASYYYGEFAQNRSLELNRCYYGAMVDDPMGKDIHTGETRCKTLEETCQDCRQVTISAIYSVHFTICGKPWWCDSPQIPLCRELRKEWLLRRHDLEKEWVKEYPGYVPANSTFDLDDSLAAYCAVLEGQQSYDYIPLRFPTEMQVTPV